MSFTSGPMSKTEMLTQGKESESVGEIFYKDFSVPGHLRDAAPTFTL